MSPHLGRAFPRRRSWRAELAGRGVLVRDCASFGMPDTVRIAVPAPADRGRLARALAHVLPSAARPPTPSGSTDRAARTGLEHPPTSDRKRSVILQPLLDAVLVDLGGTVVVEAAPGTPVADLQVELRSGVIDDLRAIVHDVRLGAVTNTAVMTEADVRALLADVGVDDLLEVLVTSVDAGAAKPDPAPLELALRRLGLDDPSRVLYVGDQPTDAAAAEAAGMPYADIADGTIALAVSRGSSGWPAVGSKRPGVRSSPPMAPPLAEAGAHQARLTKPPGSLGRLEALGIQLAAIAGVCPPPVPEPAVVAVFAGDHGVLAAGVSPWPQEVTAQMVANFCAGGAAVNVLARHAGAEVAGGRRRRRHPDCSPARAGLLPPQGPPPAPPTWPPGPAMTPHEALLALDVGAEVAAEAVAGGARCLVTGDMGIGNTTAVGRAHRRHHRPPAGRGHRPGHRHRRRHAGPQDRGRRDGRSPGSPAPPAPLDVLAEVGGLEIAALAGFIVGGAAARVPVIVDGVDRRRRLLVAACAAPGCRRLLLRRPPLDRARRHRRPRAPRPGAPARPRPAPGRGHRRLLAVAPRAGRGQAAPARWPRSTRRRHREVARPSRRHRCPRAEPVMPIDQKRSNPMTGSAEWASGPGRAGRAGLVGGGPPGRPIREDGGRARSLVAMAPLPSIDPLLWVRRALAGRVRGMVVGGTEPPLARFKLADADDPGLFGPDSVTWRIHADNAMFVGGLRGAHAPDHAPARHGRGRRALELPQRPDRPPLADQRLRRHHHLRVHRRGLRRHRHGQAGARPGQGIAPDGRSYAANDPHLLTWVHHTLVDSFLRAYRATAPARPSARRSDRYVAEMAVLADVFEAEPAARSVAELRA